MIDREPRFIPDPDAQAQTGPIFDQLTAMVRAEPEAVPGILGGYATHTEIIAAEAGLPDDDDSFRAGVVRTLAAMFRNGHDLEVGYDQDTENRIRSPRDEREKAGARCRRLAAYIGRVSRWELTQRTDDMNTAA